MRFGGLLGQKNEAMSTQHPVGTMWAETSFMRRRVVRQLPGLQRREADKQPSLAPFLLSFSPPFFSPEYIWLNSQTLNACVIQFYRLTSNKKMTGCQFTEMGNCMAGFLRLTGPPEPSAHPLPSGQSLPSDQPYLSCQAMKNLPGE